MQFHKYSLADVEGMMPWEKFVYLDLLKQHIQKLEEEARDRAAAKRLKRR